MSAHVARSYPARRVGGVPSTKAKQRVLVHRLIQYVRGPQPYAAVIDHCLNALLNQMYNRRPIARGQVTALPVTPFMRMYVRDLHRWYPHWNYQQIAEHTGLDNIGRVSEILHGKRY